MTELVIRSDSIDGDGRSPFTYQSQLDMLCYLSRDVAYWSDQIGLHLSRLLHPRREDLIGFQIWGMQKFIEQINAAVGSDEPPTVGLLLRLARAMEPQNRVHRIYNVIIERFGGILIPEKTLKLMRC